jgi:hypothetical protein
VYILNCGSYGAPFKLTCTKYGYTVIGKGTTSSLWKEVSREAQVYRILRKAQDSAVPVFLGKKQAEYSERAERDTFEEHLRSLQYT